MSNKRSYLALIVGLMAMPLFALAQDFPTLMGTNARAGHADVPLSTSPGNALLTWFMPSRGISGDTLIRNNTSNGASRTGTWLDPALADEASSVFNVAETGDPTEDAARGTTTTPGYSAAYTIPAAAGSDPTLKLYPADTESVFTWNVEPANASDRVAKSYALYVWLPIGPTLEAGTGDPIYPQRYFVYEILYGNGKRLVDVVDTFLAGFGWVRLGNGGMSTSMMFDYDGTTPIQIKLYNTVPRKTGHENDVLPDPIPVDYDWTQIFTDVPYSTLVYADAVMAIPEIGRYVASPVVKEIDSGTAESRVVHALNTSTSGVRDGDAVSFSKGVVYSNDHDTGAIKWSFSPLDESTSATTLDNDSSGVTANAPWASDTTVAGYRGADYRSAPITLVPGSEASMVYAPTMPDGSYEIVAWLSGSSSGVFGEAVQYEIHEGATVSVVTVNQDTQQGWTKIGGRRYNHDDALGEPLSVEVTNYSGLAGDGGRKAYADSIRFVGGSNLEINATPVMAKAFIKTTPSGSPVETEVTVVQDEQGRIYCLDSAGNGDGSTTLYWTYPHPTITDPLDSGAEMPTGFGTSSPLIQRIGGQDYLFTGSANGRVYCIDMTSNGDGSTSRVWSYPDDIPATAKANLGTISGSIAFTTTADGDTILVPTEEGRLYALAAEAGANRTTTLRWAFPGIDASPFANFTSSARNVNDSAWGGATDAQVADGVYATTSPNLNGGSGESEYLEATSPSSLGIPGAATIRGIEFTVVKNRTAGGPGEYIKDANVRIIKGGTRQSATDRADFISDWGTTVDARTYGGSSDLWGVAWTPSDFGAGFGVAIAVQGNANSLDTPATPIPAAQIDSIEVKVYYSESPVGPIVSSPAVAFGKIFVGSKVASGDDRGRFFSIDADTGEKVAEFNGSTLWSTSGDFVNADDFVSSPATASAADSGAADDLVFVANENRWITALKASDLSVAWTTDELGATVSGGLTFTHMNVFDSGGTKNDASIVMVPTNDGRFAGLFANPALTNVESRRRAYEYVTEGENIFASIASGRNFLYGADSAGFLYAFSNTAGVFDPADVPGEESIIENAAIALGADRFRDAKVKFVTKETYQRLRLDSTDPNLLDYAEATNVAREVTQTAFEWGETLFAMVYDFPYRVTDADGDPVSPPVLQFQMNVDGSSFRTLSVEARQLRDPATAPLGTYPPERNDGYAILAFTLQGGGVNALPPGPAEMQVSLSTQSLNGDGQRQTVDLDPAKANKAFVVANPLALVMQFSGGAPLNDYTIGYTVNPADAENAVNGSPDIAGTARLENQLTAPLGSIPHGQSGTWTIGVVDRSLMTLLRGPDRGLDNVRMTRNEFVWQGGAAAIVKPLPGTMFPAFEDYPDDTNNRSLDYPNIARERLRVTRSLFGDSENPLFNSISLDPPTNVDENDPSTRGLVATLFELGLDVPKFQPANLSTVFDSASVAVDGGYFGPISVFVDSNGDGSWTSAGGRREASRTFGVAAGVPVDERFEVTTPTVDLGDLAQGAGYSPAKPIDQTADSFLNDFAGIFQPFTVINLGNVNLLNLRLAKQYVDGSTLPWEIFSTANHEFAWLDASTNLHSDIDSYLAPLDQVILQKPRVGDRAGTRLSPNPIRRENANIGASRGPLLADVATGDPKVAVSIPIGFPIGVYLDLVRVIEDNSDDEVLNDGESYAEPSFNLRFRVQETRLTNRPSENTAAMVDDLFDGSELHQFSNGQPAGLRDANGNLVTLWTSNRPEFAPADPVAAANAGSDNPQWRIYSSSVQGVNPSAATGTSPLADLYDFVPSGVSSWFRQDAGPFPNAVDIPAMFGNAGASIVAGTARFGSPAFPAWGVYNPFDLPNANTGDNSAYFAFVGEAQRQEDRGRIEESRIIIAKATIQANGQVALSNPVPMPSTKDVPAPTGATFDPRVSKGKPAIVQAGQHATVLYTAGSSGRSTIHYAHFDGGVWRAPGILPTGGGFESVSSPNVYPRYYRGAGTNPSAGTPIIDVVFSGKIEGAINSDVYMGRLVSNANAEVVSSSYLNERIDEGLVAAPNQAVYRSVGVAWNVGGTIELKQRLNGTVTNLLMAATKRVDASTGIISYQTPLGGRVYLDPARGSVRFASTQPAKTAVLLLTYQPRFVRIAAGVNANLSAPTLLVDERWIAELSYWATSANTAVVEGPADDIPIDRYVVTYGRAANGEGQTSRPYMKTLRYGVQLPTQVHTAANGVVTTLTVSGATKPYQIDPANGRIYFASDDEDADITVTYVGMDKATGDPLAVRTDSYKVRLILETPEAPLPMQGAVNESQVGAFLDPFYARSDPSDLQQRRPGLIWLFWTSTRSGSPDVYFQTIAPKFTPQAASGG